MKAVICDAYGPPEVLRIGDVPLPLPKADEVRVRVEASSVSSADARIRGMRCPRIFRLPMRLMLGWRRPRQRIPGMEFAGVIDAVGEGVTRFHPGDAVFGMATHGANAEYLTISQAAAIALRPARLTAAEAAAIPFGALAALVFLRDVARVAPGERLLVHGAGGAVGVFAVQLGKHFGLRVTAVCGPAHQALAHSLGADQVIDRLSEDFTEGTERYDVILDTVGGTRFSRARRVLAQGGRHVFLFFGLAELWQMLWTRMRGGPRVICGGSGDAQADLLIIRDLVEAGTLRPVIGHSFALDDIVAAHRLVDSGRKQGSLVLLIQP